MTLANLTRALLIATAMLLLGAAAVSADEPDPGLLGGALGGAGDLVTAGGEVLDELPAEPLIDPVVDVVEPVIPAVAPPLAQPVAQQVAQPVVTVIEQAAEPVAALVAPAAAAAAPVVDKAVAPLTVAPIAPVLEQAEPIVERIVRPAVRASQPLAERLHHTPPAVKRLMQPVVSAAAGLSPVRNALAPAVHPLAPLIDAAEDILKPVVDPIIGVVRPLPGPADPRPVLDSIVRPSVSVVVPTAASGSPQGATLVRLAEIAATNIVGRVPGSPVLGDAPSRHPSADEAGPSSVGPGGTTPAPVRPPQAPGSMPSGTFVSSVEGGFAILILASLMISLIASRSSLSAFRIARPPSLSFAPAVPPA